MREESRAATVVRPPSPGPAVVRVTGPAGEAYYMLVERDHDPAAGGRVFGVSRLGAAACYHVLHAPVPVCECVGFHARGICVHTKLLRALAESGHL